MTFWFYKYGEKIGDGSRLPFWHSETKKHLLIICLSLLFNKVFAQHCRLARFSELSSQSGRILGWMMNDWRPNPFDRYMREGPKTPTFKRFQATLKTIGWSYVKWGHAVIWSFKNSVFGLWHSAFWELVLVTPQKNTKDVLPKNTLRRNILDWILLTFSKSKWLFDQQIRLWNRTNFWTGPKTNH